MQGIGPIDTCDRIQNNFAQDQLSWHDGCFAATAQELFDSLLSNITVYLKTAYYRLWLESLTVMARTMFCTPLLPPYSKALYKRDNSNLHGASVQDMWWESRDIFPLCI